MRLDEALRDVPFSQMIETECPEDVDYKEDNFSLDRLGPVPVGLKHYESTDARTTRKIAFNRP